MALQEIAFTSHNGRDHIQAWIYEPAADPVAVVQLVHGLGEHSRRYLHMITTLVTDELRCCQGCGQTREMTVRKSSLRMS